MTIGNALTFINRAMQEPLLRDRLNDATDLTALHAVLRNEGLTFTPFEFEDAVNSQLVKCTDWDSADQLKEFRQWWELLQQIISPAPCGPDGACSGSCGPTAKG